MGLQMRALDWAKSSADQPAVVWLHGSAGSGKSMVANTFAGLVEKEGFVLSCFFR